MDLKALCAYYDVLRTEQYPMRNYNQEIAQIFYPRRADFNVLQTPGTKREFNFDSAPQTCALILASGMYGTLTNPATQWFELNVVDRSIRDSLPVLRWLKETTLVMLEEINRPGAAFATNMFQDFLELAVFGTSVMYVTENSRRDGLLFQARPLSEFVFAENESGMIDTFIREYSMTLEQAVKQFGLEKLSFGLQQAYQKNELARRVNIVHVIKPNEQHLPGAFQVDKRFAFSDIYFEKESKQILKLAGYNEQPMFASRFYKATGEVLGRAPTDTALPDAKMLNQMAKANIQTIQKIAAPNVLVQDNSLIGAFRSSPNGISYYRQNTEKPSYMDPPGGVPVTVEMMDRLKEDMRKTFFVDQLQLINQPNMTATEVLERMQENLRLLGPVYGRNTSEKLGPQLERVYAILSRQGKIPEPPEELVGKPLKIEYTSPIAKAQRQLEVQGIMKTTEIMRMFADINPDIFDRVDFDKIATHVGVELFGIDPIIFRSDEDVAQIRDDRQQQQQSAQAVEMTQQLAGAQQSLAQANMAQSNA